MASCNIMRESITADFPFDYKDSISQRYIIGLDTATNDPYTALVVGQANGLPVRRQRYSGASQAFCNNIRMSQSGERADVWYADVTWGPPPEGTEENEHAETNPLSRPPVYNIEYIEQEYVIEKAKNIEELPHGDGKGSVRNANTDGPIVNAAGKRPDEPVVDTERNAVLTIIRNYSSLAQIIDLNETYQRTTNDASVAFGSGSVDARRLRYLLTESQGKQVENEIEYWPGVTRIEVRKTTDLVLDNVGYDYWDGARITAWKVAGERPGEPINLKLDGTESGDHTTNITYRHLEEVDYSPLLS